MSDRSSQAWFAAKRYGYGSSLPIAWQGWVALLVFSVVTLGPWLVLPFFDVAKPVLVTLILVVTATNAIALVAFGVLCARKTEGGWRWRWGERDP
jgi:hypothetical protein